jgi:hypothetical protein
MARLRWDGSGSGKYDEGPDRRYDDNGEPTHSHRDTPLDDSRSDWDLGVDAHLARRGPPSAQCARVLDQAGDLLKRVQSPDFTCAPKGFNAIYRAIGLAFGGRCGLAKKEIRKGLRTCTRTHLRGDKRRVKRIHELPRAFIED